MKQLAIDDDLLANFKSFFLNANFEDPDYNQMAKGIVDINLFRPANILFANT